MNQIVDLTGRPIQPTLDQFKKRFTSLVRGEEPEDQREEIFAAAVKTAKDLTAEIAAPVDGIVALHFLFMAFRPWLMEILSEKGQRHVEELDKRLRQMVVTVLFEAWKSLEDVANINGGGEIHESQEQGTPGSEDTVRPVPDA
jgi:hypothetical protein